MNKILLKPEYITTIDSTNSQNSNLRSDSEFSSYQYRHYQMQ
jgi:hypothetical protein